MVINIGNQKKVIIIASASAQSIYNPPFHSLAVVLNISIRVIIIWHISFPEPVTFPDSIHFFNRDPFSLRQEEEDEEGHGYHKCSKEEEETKLHLAKHGEEELADHEREEHVN